MDNQKNYDDFWNESDVNKLPDIPSDGGSEQNNINENTDENTNENISSDTDENTDENIGQNTLKSNANEQTDENDTNIPDNEENSNTDENNAINGIIINKPLKYKGKEIPITSAEEAYALMQKGLGFEGKMAKIKPYTHILRQFEEAGISEQDIVALSDLKKGKKEAINYFLKENQIDPFETTDKDYNPQPLEKDEVKEFWKEYSEQNTQNAAKVLSIYNDFDEATKAELYKPDIFPLFVASVETGEFDKVYPYAIKAKALNPAMSFVQAYQYASQNILDMDNKKSEPPVEGSIKTNQKRKTSSNVEASNANRIWDDEEYFKEFEKKFM